MFTVEERERVRDHVLALARSDNRVVSGAVVGSLALDEGDRWSDLDLTFAVADGIPLADVLGDWTQDLIAQFDAVHLFDLPAGPSIYRVFVLPGCLQFDLSFTPASQFGATGPKFKLLFGQAVDRPFAESPPAEELFGYAVHHALRARFCIERGRFWHAEYWISGVRDYALSLACRRRGLPTSHGRGFDDLPPEVRDPFRDALVRSLDRGELLRALDRSVAGLISEAHEVRALAVKLEPQLRALTVSWEQAVGKPGMVVQGADESAQRGPSEDDREVAYTIAQQLAAALDQEDYVVVARLLADDCEYVGRKGTLVGPEAIITSYRDAGSWAKSAIQNVTYESSVRIDADGGAVVTFIDHFVHDGLSHAYACEQAISIDPQGRVTRIVHRDLPGQREAADAFLRRVGLSPPE